MVGVAKSVLTSILSTIISDRSRKKKESTSTENTCVRISPATAKATSTKVDPSVMMSMPRSRMASLNALVSKAGATKLSLLSAPNSANRRAVAIPKTYVSSASRKPSTVALRRKGARLESMRREAAA